MIPKNGPLSDRHLAVLRTIQRLQPCGATSVADALGLPRRTVDKMIYQTFYRRGLVDSEMAWRKGRLRRKYGTLRLTEEGERELNG